LLSRQPPYRPSVSLYPDPPPPHFYPLSLHDALPISSPAPSRVMTGVCSRPRYEFQLMNALILPLWQRTTSQTASPNRDCPVVALSDRKTVRVSSSGFFCVETCQPPDPVTFAAVGVRE